MSQIKGDIQSQSKQVIFHVYNYFKKLSSSDKEFPADFFKKTQNITAKACGVSLRSVQKVCSESKRLKMINDSTEESNNSVSPPNFTSPRKSYKRKKLITGLNEFENDLVIKTVHELYDNCEYPTTAKIQEALKNKTGFNGSVGSVRRILNSLNFRFKQCKNDKKPHYCNGQCPLPFNHKQNPKRSPKKKEQKMVE